jgi:hypothetical protein
MAWIAASKVPGGAGVRAARAVGNRIYTMAFRIARWFRRRRRY